MSESNKEFSNLESAEPPEVCELGQVCVGSVYRADNRSIWKFDSGDPGNNYHPGVCCEFLNESGEALLLKGTSRVPKSRYMNAYISIMPDGDNGLDKETFFKLSPFPTRRHVMRRLHGFGLIGKLGSADLACVRKSMNSLFRNSAGGRS